MPIASEVFDANRQWSIDHPMVVSESFATFILAQTIVLKINTLTNWPNIFPEIKAVYIMMLKEHTIKILGGNPTRQDKDWLGRIKIEDKERLAG
jgi:hypothetical protein